MAKEKTKEKFKTRVGGQALIEGVMMLGPEKGAMAVRKPDKTIYIEEWDRKEKKWYNKAPFIRGCINFVSQLLDGYKYINKSGEISGMFEEEEEDKKKKKEKAAEETATEVTEAATPERIEEKAEEISEAIAEEKSEEAEEVKTEEAEEIKTEEKKEEKDNSALNSVLMIISSILGIGLALVLFIVLPTLITTGIDAIVPADISPFRSLIEGIVKILLFIGYLWLTSLMDTMKRLYQYHGAEHKTIFCYEHGEELTVENVRKYKRFHPRCGTSFIFLTLAISILVYTILPVNSEMFMSWLGVSQGIGDMLRICCKIIFLPIIVGISYELITLAGRYDNILTRIISAPGLGIQRLTTKEPADEMIEIAIAAVKPVIPENPEDAKW
ncbi:MAG: DUF1385 domain-containing protein [Ruminiclostridium sp.]|nr:DUF1385 domain-containing protein [Ruminiclostridium sp.]